MANNAPVSVYKEIEEVMEKYLVGGNTSSDELRKVFHPDAVVNGGSLEDFLKVIDEGIEKNGQPTSKGQVDILDVVDNIATVRITLENYHGEDFIDFHHLYKFDNGWKIVSKMFVNA
ncbi:MAG TPA: nuclear transport factor 2 family protein [Virgibacillus sp.]|nr:nuclear transport factor 2 family protein [Virgibacillus sp.]HLR68378.1 nuclear transport factor 2 family protein [Virgibacillus sp.]